MLFLRLFSYKILVLIVLINGYFFFQDYWQKQLEKQRQLSPYSSYHILFPWQKNTLTSYPPTLFDMATALRKWQQTYYSSKQKKQDLVITFPLDWKQEAAENIAIFRRQIAPFFQKIYIGVHVKKNRLPQPLPASLGANALPTNKITGNWQKLPQVNYTNHPKQLLSSTVSSGFHTIETEEWQPNKQPLMACYQKKHIIFALPFVVFCAKHHIDIQKLIVKLGDAIIIPQKNWRIAIDDSGNINTDSSDVSWEKTITLEQLYNQEKKFTNLSKNYFLALNFDPKSTPKNQKDSISSRENWHIYQKLANQVKITTTNHANDNKKADNQLLTAIFSLWNVQLSFVMTLLACLLSPKSAIRWLTIMVVLNSTVLITFYFLCNLHWQWCWVAIIAALIYYIIDIVFITKWRLKNKTAVYNDSFNHIFYFIK